MTSNISDKVFLVRVDPSFAVVQYPYEDGFFTFWGFDIFPMIAKRESSTYKGGSPTMALGVYTADRMG